MKKKETVGRTLVTGAKVNSDRTEKIPDQTGQSVHHSLDAGRYEKVVSYIKHLAKRFVGDSVSHVQKGCLV